MMMEAFSIKPRYIPNCEKIRTTEKVTPTTVMMNRVRSWKRFLRAISTIGTRDHLGGGSIRQALEITQIKGRNHAKTRVYPPSSLIMSAIFSAWASLGSSCEALRREETASFFLPSFA